MIEDEARPWELGLPLLWLLPLPTPTKLRKEIEFEFSFPFPLPLSGAKRFAFNGDVGVLLLAADAVGEVVVIDLGDGEGGGDSSSDISSKRASAIVFLNFLLGFEVLFGKEQGQAEAQTCKGTGLCMR